MSKKKNKQKHVLKSLRDLGQNGRDTLSRLATTVKADVPTVLMGDTKKADGFPSFTLKTPENYGARISRVAKRLNPFHRDENALSAKRLKKLAKQIAAGSAPAAPKVRRSRLPLVVAICAALIGGGGYYAYQSISLPDVKLSKYFDYEGWLATASGAKPQTSYTQPNYGKRTSYQAPRTAKPVTKVAEKKFRSLPKMTKKQIWEARLAKAKAASAAKYKSNAYKKSSYKRTAAKDSRAKLNKAAPQRRHYTSAKGR